MEKNEEYEKEYTWEDKVKRATDWLGKNLSGIFAFLISVFFVFQGMVDILPTNLGVKEQIITAFLNLVAGFSITSLVGEYGFTSAKNSPRFINLENGYDLSVSNALGYRNAINEFVKEQGNEELVSNRMYILEKAKLYYYDIFNEKGELNTDFDIYQYKKEKDFRNKLKAYKKAVRMKVVNTNVFGLSTTAAFFIEEEETEEQFRIKKGLKSIIIKVLLSITSVGIMFVFIGFSLGAIFYAFMQIVLWTAMGLIDRQKNYNFTMNKTYKRIKNRKQLIDEFMAKSEEDKQYYVKKAMERKQPKIKALPFIPPNH